MQPEDVLQKFSLTKAEAKLYLELLRNGTATASELAKRTTTNRTFTYDRLKKLLETGLASSIIKENKSYFLAARPTQLLALLKEREAEVKSVLPELERTAQRRRAEEAHVEIYSSKQGVRTALNLTLKEKKCEILLHGTISKFRETMDFYFDLWNRRREENRITLRALTNEELELPLAAIDLLNEQTETTTLTFHQNVLIIIWSQTPVAILIESREIAEESRLFFNTIWNREIKIYSGVTGIRKAWMEVVAEQQTELVGYGFSYKLAQIYGRDFSQRWHRQRIKNRIVTRLIADDDEASRKYFDVRMMEWQDFTIQFLAKEYNGPACITLTEKLLVEFIYTEKQLKVILNKNPETIRAYRKHFETLWKRAHQKTTTKKQERRHSPARPHSF